MATSAERKPIQRLRSDSCDSASSGEAADSDDSDDDAPLAKKKCPSSRLDSLSSHVSGAPVQPSTKNNIWGSVLQEQSLAKDLGDWFGMKTKVISYRDVETYDYRSAKSCAANESSADPVDIDITDCEEPLENGDDDNICDRETFGTSANVTSSSDRARKTCSDDEQSSRKRRHNGTKAGFTRQPEDANRQSAKNRLSKRTYDREKDRSHICVSVNDSAADVAQELVRILGEPEHMKETFGKFSNKNSNAYLSCTEKHTCSSFLFTRCRPTQPRYSIDPSVGLNYTPVVCLAAAAANTALGDLLIKN